ncbi:pleckstrin homology domain-containing family O member 1-A [Denticeps clupeoides]|uniref:PH domain-containing protein n=1 Tax=Denticeps clupeoides TaxID=299321 RepID=A0AAY4CUE2_9TELE|nr:pleckstrin homology domain-containing family O member 1-A-like [Denticeps clupeoides]
MKRSSTGKRGLRDASQMSAQPDKVGWIRKFCGRGLFREIWRSRFVMLKGDHLYVFEKEIKDNGKTHEVFDLAEYERSEELRKTKSSSKKNHSKFTLLRCRQPGNRTPNLVFLALSPEEKESWINVLNAAIGRAKNRILDEVITEEGLLAHPTRFRAKIPPGRRLPTRGHLMTVASTSSDGMLTLDLVHEEDTSALEDEESIWVKDFRVDVDSLAPGRRRSGTDVSKLKASSREGQVKTSSLPRGSERSWGRPQDPEGQSSVHGRSRCASMDDTVSRGERRLDKQESSIQEVNSPHDPTERLQELITQRLQRTQELLNEVREQDTSRRARADGHLRGVDSPSLKYLKESESPRSKGSGSPQSKNSDSPSLKANDSPRLKVKDSPRFRTKESPRQKRSKSPHCKNKTSPKLSDSRGPHSPLVKNPNVSHIRGTDSPLSANSNSPRSGGAGSPRLKGEESPSVRAASSPYVLRMKAMDSPLQGCVGGEWEGRWQVAERLLQEAVSSWQEAREVLEEVRQLQERQLQERQRRAEQGAGATTMPPQNPTSTEP